MLRQSSGRFVWLLFAAALAVGCASVSSDQPEEEVRQRAQARWNALMEGDWAQAYRYMAPSYRALVEQKRYANQFGGGAAWLAAEPVKVACAEDRCTVEMKVTFRPVIGARTSAPATTHFDETWIREDGQWWMFQKP